MRRKRINFIFFFDQCFGKFLDSASLLFRELDFHSHSNKNHTIVNLENYIVATDENVYLLTSNYHDSKKCSLPLENSEINNV